MQGVIWLFIQAYYNQNIAAFFLTNNPALQVTILLRTTVVE